MSRKERKFDFYSFLRKKKERRKERLIRAHATFVKHRRGLGCDSKIERHFFFFFLHSFFDSNFLSVEQLLLLSLQSRSATLVWICSTEKQSTNHGQLNLHSFVKCSSHPDIQFGSCSSSTHHSGFDFIGLRRLCASKEAQTRLKRKSHQFLLWRSGSHWLLWKPIHFVSHTENKGFKV